MASVETSSPLATYPKSPLAVCGLAFVLALGSCTGGDLPGPEAAPLRPVKYVEVVAQRGDRTRTFTGFAKVDARSKLGFRVSGTVQGDSRRSRRHRRAGRSDRGNGPDGFRDPGA